jgi:hypothetical protein
MVDDYQAAALDTRLGIPIIYGVDAVHGHNNLKGAVIFPHNIGLGATRDPDLVREIARVTALEMAPPIFIGIMRLSLRLARISAGAALMRYTARTPIW